MKLDDFKVEQWMNDYEDKAIYNMTDTCIQALHLNDIISDNLEDILLDYGEIPGSKAVRQAILSLYKNKDIEEVTTTNGALEANTLVMETILEAGDHVVTCIPGYQQFTSYPRSLGCSVSEILLDDDWDIGVQELVHSILPETKMIILNNPNNPTGTNYSKTFLEDLIEVCRPNNIWILCDEVYRDPDFTESISDLYEFGVSTSSLSKLYGLAGLRFGWVKGQASLIKRINSRKDYTMISTGPLKDVLALKALQRKDELLNRSRNILKENKQILEQWLQEKTQFDCVIPQSGTVAFLKIEGMTDSEKTALFLLKEYGIFFVPGACFGFEGYMRLGLGQEPKSFRSGLDMLWKVISQNDIEKSND